MTPKELKVLDEINQGIKDLNETMIRIAEAVENPKPGAPKNMNGQIQDLILKELDKEGIVSHQFILEMYRELKPGRSSNVKSTPKTNATIQKFIKADLMEIDHKTYPVTYKKIN